MSLERDKMEFEIGHQVSQSILKFHGEGISPEEVMSIYVASVGVGLSLLWEDSTASSVYNVCGNWARKGFTDANAMDIDP